MHSLMKMMKKMMKTMNSRLSALLALVALLASCHTQPIPEKPAVDPADETMEYHISAHCSDTKTANAGMSTVWVDDDEIAAIYKSGGSYESARFTYEGNDSFTANIAIPDQPCDWFAIYPYSADFTKPSTASISIPAASTQEGNGSMAHLAGNGFPLYGKATKVKGEPDIPMAQFATVCCFEVTNGNADPIVVTGISFTAPGALCGSFTSDLTAASPVLTPAQTSNSVSLKINDGEELAKGDKAKFYLGMAPFALEGEFTIRIDAECGGKTIYSEKTVTTAMSFASGTINTIPYKFKKAEQPEQKAFVKLTEAPAKWDGTYLVVYESSTTSGYVFAPLEEYKNSHYTYGKAVAIQDGVIPSDGIVDALAITVSDKGEKHRGKGISDYDAYLVQNSARKYVFYSQSELRLFDTNWRVNSEGLNLEYSSVFMLDGSGVRFVTGAMRQESSPYNLYYSTSSKCFKYATDHSTSRVQLYKLTGDVTPDPVTDLQDQTLTFAQPSVTVDAGYGYSVQIGSSIDMPQTVTGAQTAVSYSSSDTSVASIDGSKIRIVAAGTTTITATAAATDKWNSASAEYTLIIVNHERSDEAGYYIKVTEAPGEQNWGGVYLIVNKEGNKALSALNSTIGLSSVTVVGDIIEGKTELQQYEFTISGGTAKHQKGGSNSYAYDIMNSQGNYLFCNSSGAQIGNPNTSDGVIYQHTLTLDANGVQIMSAKNSTSSGNKYYLTYSTSGGFSYNQTSSNRVYLYRWETGPIQHSQNLSFAQSSVLWWVGEGQEYTIGSTYTMPQAVAGAQTAVTYSSSNTSVASIVDGTKVKINGTGTTTITATAAGSDEYKSASASYTLTITEVAQYFNKELGNFELVNKVGEKSTSSAMYYYLEEATRTYKDDDWSSVSLFYPKAQTKYDYGSNGDLSESNSNIKAYDRPAPVTIPLDGYNGSNVTVTIFTDSAMTSQELSVAGTISNSAFEVYNLIPNREYWYSASIGGNAVSSGHFTTTGRRRIIKVSDTKYADNANNCRDFGGLQAGDGTLRYNLIFRGSNMDKTTAAEQRIITDYLKVKLDVDLRNSSGSGRNDAKQPITSIGYKHSAFNGWTDLQNSSKIKDVMSAIMTSVCNGEAVYIHCFAGADRTGYICMLLEAVCGVSEKDCTIDYELTSFSCVGIRDRCSKVKSSYMKDGLPYIEKYRGNDFQEKATNILLDAGISQKQIDNFKAAMVKSQ